MTKPHELGHIVAKTFYARVERRRASPTLPSLEELECIDLLNQERFSVRGSQLIEKFVSADTWETEKKVTKTELARRLVEAGPAPFTVHYQKADGTSRALRGLLVDHEDLLGRSMVHDFDVTEGPPLRQVDHRTLKSLIINGVRYTLKGAKEE